MIKFFKELKCLCHVHNWKVKIFYNKIRKTCKDCGFVKTENKNPTYKFYR